MIRSSILAAFALALAAPALAGEAAPKDFAARTELYPIHTLTLSDKQFLTGDAEAKATEVGGVLRLPPTAGRLPVVVFMSVSSGQPFTYKMLASNMVRISAVIPRRRNTPNSAVIARRRMIQ